ncbi:MAG: CPXCG motif-containing cysteine-rich protein [Alphaproteobacteria bacterium]|nr:MAG: CPXCG motif-containing cysteine-rich protein [Alphaproteobacteria bacterium]
MNALEALNGRCPHCGSAITLTVDTTAGEARYVEDCPVCCQPIEVHLTIHASGSGIELFREGR